MSCHSENKFNIGRDQDLLGQMSVMREKATESEAVVRNITKDIQVLDTAKKNLILSMTTLKRMQMLGMRSKLHWIQNTHSVTHNLVNALLQLEDLVKEKRYTEVAQTLAVSLHIAQSRWCDLNVTRRL